MIYWSEFNYLICDTKGLCYVLVLCGFRFSSPSSRRIAHTKKIFFSPRHSQSYVKSQTLRAVKWFIIFTRSCELLLCHLSFSLRLSLSPLQHAAELSSNWWNSLPLGKMRLFISVVVAVKTWKHHLSHSSVSTWRRATPFRLRRHISPSQLTTNLNDKFNPICNILLFLWAVMKILSTFCGTPSLSAIWMHINYRENLI